MYNWNLGEEEKGVSMSDLISDFENADTMKLSLSFDYMFDPGDVGKPGALKFQDLCIMKPSGKLEIILTPSDLGFQALPFDIHLEGVRNGIDNKGRLVIQWSVNQVVNKAIPGQEVIIDQLVGQVTTAQLALDPPLEDTNCGGSCHAYLVQFETIGEDNWIIGKGHVTKLSHDYGASLKLLNLQLYGTAAIPLSLALEIYEKKDDCGIGAITGENAWFLADVYGVPKSLSATCEWTVFGAEAITHSKNQWALQVNVPISSTTFTITATVTTVGCTISKTKTITPLSLDEATKTEGVCKLLRHYTMINMFINPLGPDVTIPISLENVRKIQQAAEHVLQLTDTMIKLYESKFNT